MKKLIRRVIAWEVDPLREQLVRLQKASLQAAETTDARLEELADELDAELPETRPDARPETPVVSPDAGDR